MRPLSLDLRLRRRLAELERSGLTRRLPPISHRAGVRYRIGDQDVVGFCSNDYLGFADQHTPATEPSGAGGSRLICGDLPCHRELEQGLADLAGQDDAVVFPSGFQLNLGLPSALMSPEDIVYSDKLNHASIIDGLRLARAQTKIIPHRSPVPAQKPSPESLTWWVTESVFSMDGDSPSPDSLRAAQARGVSLYIDDAHGIGLFDHGQGWPQAHKLLPTVYVATLSKAFGCAGGFVAASATVCEWIRTRCRSFVFSTGMSPQAASASLDALHYITSPRGDAARDRLRTNIEHLNDALGLPRSRCSPIFPIVLGDNATATEAAQRLLVQGWHVQAIRPPTVPRGTARLRITVSSSHEPNQIEGLLAAMRIALGAPPRELAVAPHS